MNSRECKKNGIVLNPISGCVQKKEANEAADEKEEKGTNYVSAELFDPFRTRIQTSAGGNKYRIKSTFECGETWHRYQTQVT